MSKGLEAMLKKIRAMPENRVLVTRFLSLAVETEDLGLKQRLLLGLADAVREASPMDAVAVAYMVFQHDRTQLIGLEIIVDALRLVGRHAKAQIIENELEKLRRVAPMSPLSEAPQSQAFPADVHSLIAEIQDAEAITPTRVLTSDELGSLKVGLFKASEPALLPVHAIAFAFEPRPIAEPLPERQPVLEPEPLSLADSEPIQTPAEVAGLAKFVGASLLFTPEPQPLLAEALPEILVQKIAPQIDTKVMQVPTAMELEQTKISHLALDEIVAAEPPMVFAPVATKLTPPESVPVEQHLPPPEVSPRETIREGQPTLSADRNLWTQLAPKLRGPQLSTEPQLIKAHLEELLRSVDRPISPDLGTLAWLLRPALAEEMQERSKALSLAFWSAFSGIAGARLLQKWGLAAQAPQWWGQYLDLLLSAEKARHALAMIRATVQNQSALEWSIAAMERLPRIWQMLDLSGFHWQKEDGVRAFCSALALREGLLWKQVLSTSPSET